ncbi:hypothetical protein NEISUBOT_03117 [Neisseria subflava NJ9703]|uniref:Uncharacterized protein n=1 Tax=Neisseria subflava NJ9703 TaxID=546268 RepID=A0A9W5N0C0_NEISU|nr:hypothetical protein NEISUBOT_03117 [Neisseria subflava NJ9703]
MPSEKLDRAGDLILGFLSKISRQSFLRIGQHAFSFLNRRF